MALINFFCVEKKNLVLAGQLTKKKQDYSCACSFARLQLRLCFNINVEKWTFNKYNINPIHQDRLWFHGFSINTFQRSETVDCKQIWLLCCNAGGGI